jgi:membrane associated rhomboid family serine protease
VLYPHVRVFCLVPPFFIAFALPAWTMLLYWFFLQFVGGLAGLGAEEGGGVAFWAHAGGFVAGLVLIKLFARPEYVEAHRAGHWSPRRLRAS